MMFAEALWIRTTDLNKLVHLTTTDINWPISLSENGHMYVNVCVYICVCLILDVA